MSAGTGVKIADLDVSRLWTSAGVPAVHGSTRPHQGLGPPHTGGLWVLGVRASTIYTSQGEVWMNARRHQVSQALRHKCSEKTNEMAGAFQQ